MTTGDKILVIIFLGFYFWMGHQYGYRKGRESMKREANTKICRAMAKGKICQ